MLRRIAILLYPRGSVRRVLRGCRKGFKFVVRDAMGASFSLGLADEERFAVRFKELIRHGSHVIDVGANRGQMALLFARLTGPSGKVVAVEPMQDLVNDLKRNCDLNRLSHVSAICAAAADYAGEANFAFSDTHQTQGKMTSVEPTYVVEGAKEVVVATTTLDEIARSERLAPTFVKIDVEGAARVVLQGAHEILTMHRPTIYIELHGQEEVNAVAHLESAYSYSLETMDGEPIYDLGNRSGGPVLCRPSHMEVKP